MSGWILYVGVAMDLAEQVREHNSGVGAGFTVKRRPVELIWWQVFADQKEARQREAELKGWRREKKLRLLVGFGDRNLPSAAKMAAVGEIGDVGDDLRPQKARPQGEIARGGRFQGSRPTVRTPVSKTGYGGSNPSSPARD
jgi:putative endonuclease